MTGGAGSRGAEAEIRREAVRHPAGRSARGGLATAATATARPATVPPMIEVRGVEQALRDAGGPQLTVLEDVDLSIGANEFVSIVGRSGCGKTTLLNILAGLEQASEGRSAHCRPDRRRPGQGQGVVFQQHALFPWLTALENVAFGARSLALPKAAKRERARDLLQAGRSGGVPPANIRGNCRAACSSASPSRARWRSTRNPADGRAVRRARRTDADRDAAGIAADLGSPQEDRGLHHALHRRGAQSFPTASCCWRRASRPRRKDIAVPLARPRSRTDPASTRSTSRSGTGFLVKRNDRPDPRCFPRHRRPSSADCRSAWRPGSQGLRIPAGEPDRTRLRRADHDRLSDGRDDLVPHPSSPSAAS